MKVEYEKTMMDRLTDVLKDSMLENRVIKCVRLCKEEWKRLEEECRPTFCYSWHDFNVAKRVKLLGMRVDSSEESMSTVCHEYEDTGYPSMIRDLEKRIEILASAVDGSRIKRVELEKEKEQFRNDANLMTNKYWQERNKLSNLEANLRKENEDLRSKVDNYDYYAAHTSALRKDNAKLRREKDYLREMKSTLVGLIKQERALKEAALEEGADMKRELLNYKTGVLKSCPCTLKF